MPPKHRASIHALPVNTYQGEPSVKYRGIFINDEAPALTGWVLENFGSYGPEFYKKVYELLLRLKVCQMTVFVFGQLQFNSINHNGRQTLCGQPCGLDIQIREPYFSPTMQKTRGSQTSTA